MSIYGVLQAVLFCVVIVAITPTLGGYMTRLFTGQPVLLIRVLGPVERGLYRLGGIRPDQDQSWKAYALSVLVFSLLGMIALFALQLMQASLPLNPARMGAVPADLAFNTAASFVSNTNWQAYGGETTMSYLTQMLGLTVQNFLSAATGIAVAVALVRAFADTKVKNKETRCVGIGNFWVDMTRAVLYLLLPICVVGVLVLVWQGVPQTLGGSVEVTTLEGAKQTIARGPVATQMMIKHLGTNGGGFFNANAAHPFENPTPLVNFIHMVAIFAIGAALTNFFGRMVRDTRQGWVLFGAMAFLFLIGLAVAWFAEIQGNPALTALGIDGVMEGKETRFGIAASILFAVVTTVTSCGAVNSMFDSLMPLTGLVPMVNMMLGEVIVGGVGSGLYGILVFALLAVFIAGLMVGRSPEYLGKKIESREIKLAMLTVLIPSFTILGLGGLAMVFAGPQLPGPHGLSQVLYAYTSAAANNGSAFAGFNANTLYHNIMLGLAMLVGRFCMIVPVLALAGALIAKTAAPPSAGTFPTHGYMFAALLVAVIVVVGGLTFFPVLALGPVADHLLLGAGLSF